MEATTVVPPVVHVAEPSERESEERRQEIGLSVGVEREV